ncbi:MAG: DUF502 domain-containing protein [Gammaproteobacteria bacterium]
MQFIRVTVIGGVIFLVPVTVLIMILGKTVDIMGRLAKPLTAWVPLDRIGGVAVANLIAIVGIIVLCFIAGLIARSGVVTRYINSLESRFLYSIPGYSFVKSLTSSMAGVDDDKSLTPVLAKFDDASQIAFKVESLPDGRVIVYIPGAPDPWSGSVFVMSADRIELLDLSLMDAVKNIRTLGSGSSDFLPPPTPD